MQEGSFLGREIACCGIQRQDMGCVQNGIALSLTHAPASRSRSHTRSRTQVLQPVMFTPSWHRLCAPPSHGHDATTAPISPRKTHRCRYSRATGQPDSRAVGLSARPIADMGRDGQNNVAAPDQSDCPTRRLHVAGQNN